MKINNIDISKFKAKLMSRSIRNVDFSVETFWPKKSINPYINENVEHKFKELNMTLDLLCSNANELEIIKSNLEKELEISTIEFDDIENFKYYGFCIEPPLISEYIVPGNEIISVKMHVYCVGKLKEEILNKVNFKSIKNPGNLETPAIVEIIPSIDAIDLQIEGLSNDPIIIKNLHANKKIIINGKEGLITEDGINKFNDTDFWEFPFLNPGENQIKLSKDNCNVVIKFEPRYR